MADAHVKFVDYTGRYPNLCSGVLTLEIDGQQVRFGHDYMIHDSWKTDGNYESFWRSGGSCGFSSDWSDEYVNHGEWEIDIDSLPEKYKKYAEEIAEEFNSSVPYGCCGGCL